MNTSTHDTILFFTSKGRVFRTKGYEVPEFSRTAKGLPIINLLGVDKEEKVTAMIPVDEFEEDKYFFFVTQNGVAKGRLFQHSQTLDPMDLSHLHYAVTMN